MTQGPFSFEPLLSPTGIPRHDDTAPLAKRGASRPPARLQNRACEFPRTRLLGGRSLSRIPRAAVGGGSRLWPSGGLEAALWELADALFPLPRGQGLPFIPERCRRAHDVCTLTRTASFRPSWPTSAYPGHYPGPWLLGPSHPPPGLRLGGPCSASDPAESPRGVTTFLMLVLRSRRVALSAGLETGEWPVGSRSAGPQSLSPFGPAWSGGSPRPRHPTFAGRS